MESAMFAIHKLDRRKIKTSARTATGNGLTFHVISTTKATVSSISILANSLVTNGWRRNQCSTAGFLTKEEPSKSFISLGSLFSARKDLISLRAPIP